MGISYKKLWILLVEKDISQATFRKDLNIATGTMTKMRRNEEVALSVLLRICEYLDCNIGDICDAVKKTFWQEQKRMDNRNVFCTSLLAAIEDYYKEDKIKEENEQTEDWNLWNI